MSLTNWTTSWTRLLTLLSLPASLLFAGTSPPDSSYTINKTTLTWKNISVGLTSEQSFTVQATSSATVTVSSFSFMNGGTGFQLAQGIFPRSFSGSGNYRYTFRFVPTAAKAYNDVAVFIINGSPVNITLTATGITTTAVASLSQTSASFSAPLGSSAAAVPITVTNTGNATVSITDLTTQLPFTVTGLTLPYSLAAGKTATFSVNYFATTPGVSYGDVLIKFSLLPSKAVSLQGTALAASGFAITNHPTLPLGTQGAAYLAQLLTTGGAGNVTYTLTSGSTLPTGLSLSSTGAISGTIGSKTALSTYSFTVQATDSVNTQALSTMSLQVLAPTGSACNDIAWNVGSTTTPILPINDLGTGTYLGAQGGLYGSGSNTPPASHQADGIALAQGIQPLDINGNPDSVNGKYVLLEVGISTMGYEGDAFLPIVNADPSRNSHLVVVNGGQAQARAADFAMTSSPFWTTITQYMLPNAGVSNKQVVAVQFEDIDATPKGVYPSDMTMLQGEYETMAQGLLTLFPNIKLLYFSSRIYSGYSGTFDLQDPEPYAYESGLAMRSAILDQINGLATLNYNPANGPVFAPWMSWGTYVWANGMNARSDGLTYSCQELLGDGRHPSPTYGAPKVAGLFLNFFKSDPTTAPWFSAPSGGLK